MKYMNDFCNAVQGDACVAFGSFDGMHLGHRAVLARLAAHTELTPVLLSFSDEINPVIYTESEKAFLAEKAGVQVMVSAPAEDMAVMTAEAFARDILVGKLHAAVVVIGENACIGADGLDAAAFAALGGQLGFAVEAVPTVLYDGQAVSAQSVKDAIAAGDFARMGALLGHTYIMQGVVVHGKAAGRKHGMPTANLGVAKNKLFPPHGVYGTLTRLEGDFYRGMTNIGLRPSDDNIPIPTVETFLLNFDRDIYDKPITLEVYTYIRGVKKFAGGLDEVRKQIDKDIEAVRVYMDDVVSKLKR